MNRIVNPALAVAVAVANISAAVGVGPMTNTNGIYVFTSSTACWIKQGTAAQTAVVGDPANLFVPAGVPVLLMGQNGAHLAVIRHAADGHCSLAPTRGI